MQDPSYQNLMEYALRALSRRAHTIFEMSEKLQKRPHHTQSIEEKIIARLIELNLLNDEAYIKRAIESAVNYKYEGLYKVTQKLYKKGIPIEDTQKIWKEMKVPERDVAIKALKKAEKSMARAPKAKRYLKRAQYLASRGFTPDIVLDLAKLDESN